jgi:probable addiction module antidote protein
MKVQFAPLDIATLLEDDAAIEYFVRDAVEEGDPSYLAHSIGIAARAKGMSIIADETGLAREALYRSFSEDGNPSLKSTIAVLKSLGLGLSVRSLAAIDADRAAMMGEDDADESAPEAAE